MRTAQAHRSSACCSPWRSQRLMRTALASFHLASALVVAPWLACHPLRRIAYAVALSQAPRRRSILLNSDAAQAEVASVRRLKLLRLKLLQGRAERGSRSSIVTCRSRATTYHGALMTVGSCAL